MPKRQEDKPMYKITMARHKLQLYANLGDEALEGQTPQELAVEVLDAFETLMKFSNIVRGLVSFEREPLDEIKEHLD